MNIICSICNKECKSIPGLKLHILYKHKNYIRKPLTKKKEKIRIENIKKTYKKQTTIDRVSKQTIIGMANTDLTERNKKISKSRTGGKYPMTEEGKKRHVGKKLKYKYVNHHWLPVKIRENDTTEKILKKDHAKYHSIINCFLCEIAKEYFKDKTTEELIEVFKKKQKEELNDNILYKFARTNGT